MSNETLTKEEVFKPGDAVTYHYGSRKVHGTVEQLSKTGQRVRIKFKWNQSSTWDDRAYVMPKNLERGHV